MGDRIRIWEPGKIFDCSQRTVDQQFLLKPTAESRNIIGSSLGRAQEKSAVRLYWFEQNINHPHYGLGAVPGRELEVSEFLRNFNSSLARGINRTLGRSGALFSSKLRAEAIGNEQDLERKLLYAVMNPVKDGLIDSISRYPGFTCYHHLAHGAPLQFDYIDWQAWWRDGGPRNRKPLSDYRRFTKVELTPLPHWEGMTEAQRQSRFRHLVKEEEARLRALRAAEGRTVIGLRKLAELDPRARPKTPKESGRRPYIHTSDPELRRDYEAHRRDVCRSHRASSIRFLGGELDVEFPAYTYRPPLITLHRSSGL